MKNKQLLMGLALILMLGIFTACSSKPEAGADETQTAKQEMPDGSTDETSGQEVTDSGTAQATPPETAETNAADKAVSEGQRLKQTIPAPSLTNNIIGERLENEIAVYLPAGYETSGKQYSVLYFLPGFGDTYDSYLGILCKNISDEMIIVTINGINKLGGSFYYNSPVTGNWEDFVTKDVIAYVDTNYRTIASPEGRGLAGHSMGGFGVLSIAMHTKDIYGYAYSMSPGVMDENGMETLPVSFESISGVANLYGEMDEEAAREAYLLVNEKNFSLAYGSAFAPDPDGKAPYIKLPESEGPEDENWLLFWSGYGNMEEKVNTYGDNLKALKGLTIEYGEYDNYRFIREGCDHFSELLNEKEIPHELLTFAGGHGDQMPVRMAECVIPYFVRNLATPQ